MSANLGLTVVLSAAAFIAFAAPARAQAIRCENLVFTEERIACYYYRASMYPGQSCLFCAPPPQLPAKRIRKKRRMRH